LLPPLELRRVADAAIGECVSMLPYWKRPIACLGVLLVLLSGGPAGGSLSADALRGTTGNSVLDHLEAVFSVTPPVVSGERSMRSRNIVFGTSGLVSVTMCAAACWGPFNSTAAPDYPGRLDTTGLFSLLRLHCLLTL